MTTYTIKYAYGEPYGQVAQAYAELNAIDANVAPEHFVAQYARTQIEAANVGDASDNEIFATWLASGELEEAVAAIKATA